MGSFGWDPNPCCVQYHNGRPLSVALVEPADDNEVSSFVHSDFAVQCHPRSHSSGRRFQRESYRIYHPNVQYTAFHYSPPFQQRVYDYGSSREGFLEKFETITIEEQCQPRRQCIRRSPTPVRQVKIRSRPSSCFDLHKKEAAATDNNQWTQIVDERTEEHHNWHYNFTLPLQTSATTTSIATQHEDVRVPITSTYRPLKKDMWTSTEDLPRKQRRPLSISETQVLERYEKNEKIRRDSITEKSDAGTFTQVLSHRPLHRSFDGTRSHTSLNIYPEYRRNQMIVRPTAKPLEALCDAPAIVAPPTESELAPPLFTERRLESRYYHGPI